MHKSLFDLYFEIEKELGDDVKKEVGLMADVIQKLGDRKEKEKNPIAQDALGALLERVKKSRARSLENVKELDSYEEKEYRFLLKLLKDKLGKDLDEAIAARRRLQLEEIAKKYIQKFVEKDKKDIEESPY